MTALRPFCFLSTSNQILLFMQNQLPLKNLTRLNWVVTLLLSLLVYIFYVALTHEAFTGLSRVLECFVFTACVSFGNISLRKIALEKTKSTAGQAKTKFYLLSYLYAILVWLFVKQLHSALTGTEWEGDGPHILEAYTLAFLATAILNTLIIVLQD